MRFCLFFVLAGSLILYSCGNRKPAVLSIFEQMDPEVTHVDFINTNTDTDSLNILDYLYFYNGGGLASADFNNDGLEDLYFVSNQAENKLYLNKGNLKFADITAAAGVKGTGNWKTGVTVVDINGDGFRDIYVSVVSGYKSFRGKNQLYINNGDLTFTDRAAEYGLDFAGLSTQAAFFDYDKDGDLDMFLLTHSVHNSDTYGDSTQRFKYNHDAGDHLFRNDNGHFKDVTQKSGIYASAIGYGLGVSIGDLNNDGWDDLYVSNDFFEQDYYYINQQNGTFKEQLKAAFGHTSQFSMGTTVSDINKDGYLDVLSTDMLPEDMAELKSTINDKPADVYNQEVESGFYYQNSRNCLQLNVGKGQKFVDIGLYAGVSATDWTWSPLVQDFDLDGQKDLFFSNGIKKRLNDLDYLKYLNNPNVQRKSQSSRVFDRESINRMPDGRVHNFLYRGSASLKFTDISAGNDMQQPSSSAGAMAVDLDNDGDLEIVTNNLDEPAFIYKNTSIESPGFRRNARLNISVRYKGRNPDGVGTKIFLKTNKRVDHQEVQTSNAFQSGQSLNLLFSFLPGERPLEMLVVWPDNSRQVITLFQQGRKQLIRYEASAVTKDDGIERAIAEFIRSRQQFDSKPLQAELLTTLSTSKTPDFNYYNLLPHAYLPGAPALAVADINHDGWDDMYIGGKAGDEKYLLLAAANRKFKKLSIEAFKKFSAYDDADACWFDADNDGDLDLIVQSANHPFTEPAKLMQPRLYLNQGDFRFEYKALPAVSNFSTQITAVDLNGDGLKDLLFSGGVSFRDYSRNLPTAVLINRGKGSFQTAQSSMYAWLTSIRYVRDITVADIDKDGNEDLVFAAEWQPLQIFLNKGKKWEKLHSPVLDDLKGWWQTACIADIDMDGKNDLIAGNWGLNNKFNVSRGKPLYAYNDDVDKDGKNDLILSYNYAGKYYPFRPKNDLEQELPYLKKDWLSYRKMADKTTEEIFKDRLSVSRRLEANTFKSIFISDVLNARSPTDLPFLYQQAPLRAIAPVSGKGDEVLIAGNFWGVIPYEGKYDAMGLVSLRYDRTGRKFANPLYRINPAINFREIEHLYPLKRGGTQAWLACSYDGRVLLLSE